MCTQIQKAKKWLPWQHPLEPRNRLCLHRIAWPRKHTPGIKQRVATYHTTKLIAQKASYCKLHPKIGAMATSRASLDPHLTHDICGPSKPTTASRSVQPFLYTWPQSVPILYNGTSLSPSKLPLPIGGSGPPSNTWFLGPTWVLNPNGISVGAVIFAGFTCVRDRPTDHATRSVTIGRIYVRSIVMWPNYGRP